MNLEEKYISLIKFSIYKTTPQAQIFIFGSRAKNTNQKFSDIDIAIKDKNLNNTKLAKIRFELEESELPYKVDISDFNDLSSEIIKDLIKIK